MDRLARTLPEIPRCARDKLNAVLFVLVDQRWLWNVGDDFQRDALQAWRAGRSAEVILPVFLETLEEVMQVVRQAHDRSAELVLHALERFEIIAAQGREE